MTDAAPTSRRRLAEIGALLAEPARASCSRSSTAMRGRRARSRRSPASRPRPRAHTCSASSPAACSPCTRKAGIAISTSPTKTSRTSSRRYRHLAGQLGVALFECLRGHDALELGSDAIRLNAAGARWLHEAGLFDDDDEGLALGGRSCVDWTERRFHLAGALGNHLASRLFERGWLRPRRDSRALALGAHGDAGLRALGIDWTRL